MLPSKFKLKKQEIKNIFIKRNHKLLSVIRGSCFDLKLFSFEKKNGSVIVSSKTLKRAVDRNKIKRMFYGILEKIFKDQKNNTKNIVFIFYPTKKALEVSFFILEKEVYNVVKNFFKII